LVWVVCGMLLVCLASTELPELLTLTNNTSNDFTTFLRSSNASSAVYITVVDHQQKDAGATPLPARPDDCFLGVVDTVAMQIPRDPLELHSFWRT
jgi:hypothetical protein